MCAGHPGEAGVGKTALAEEIVAERPPPAGESYGPPESKPRRPSRSVASIRSCSRSATESAHLDADDQDVLAPVYGADAMLPPSPMPLAMAVLAAEHAAGEQPVLLVVDDVHWLDDISATVLSAAGRRSVRPQAEVPGDRPPASRAISTAGWDELICVRSPRRRRAADRSDRTAAERGRRDR